MEETMIGDVESLKIFLHLQITKSGARRLALKIRISMKLLKKPFQKQTLIMMKLLHYFKAEGMISILY